MTLISNDPGWIPGIDAGIIYSYFVVAIAVGVMYDWALTFGQEIELVWRQHWSLMTVLYLSVRYGGIIYIVIDILGCLLTHTVLISSDQWHAEHVLTIQVADTVSLILYMAPCWMTFVVNGILGVIMISRLHAMYQRSRKVLIILVVTFLAVRIVNGVVIALALRHTSAEELILFGTYQCGIFAKEDYGLLISMTWIFTIVWEALVLYLAVRIAVEHFRQLRRHSAGGMIGDCFTVLTKSHVIYFASFVAASCLVFATELMDQGFTMARFYAGFREIFQVVQMFVLGPRLILSIREFHAKLVTDSNAGTAMTSIAFQERTHVSTSSSV